ncbi:Phosphoribosylaminoimidazolesuccinocarboxamide synthase [Methylocella silvestris BL2]|uniref:Phosphoribosylaminoimidazole-succinocarboxamide synthase n=1 Tax=Methylocella silvestris (strain DSM 15510 / CIP 108128 / LMG 27833 / NCIMB 13906 / BL2) TaxID=395965 RepID=B8EKR2_METSB|nr:phosphoribosylaminoimidazolesuccinocarboxamide synthase [Methylocella silvestris]ACK51940.1 Phosphoribosylaminoimidazolesuccinocarboxamide synthase [Methylocella silvestris BL2]
MNRSRIDAASLAPYRDYLLEDAFIPELPNYYRGKVRENYDLPNGERILIATDRVSAFDQNLASIPFKGQVLTDIARFWFEATADICPNHVRANPDPNVVVVERLEMMPVEIIVRDYLAGSTATSILTMYKAGARRMYGLDFADGLRANEKLPQTIVTPTSKAGHGSHDAPLTADEILDSGLLTPRQWEDVCEKALALFTRGREIAAGRGLILADTKYEFGFNAEGHIVLADEIHTPDSSRYWLEETYPERLESGGAPDSLDKDFIRNWVSARCDPYRDPIPQIPPDVILEAAATYIRTFETISGRSFVFPEDQSAPLDRIRANLAFYWTR